jgi:hypothetical protein
MNFQKGVFISIVSIYLVVFQNIKICLCAHQEIKFKVSYINLISFLDPFNLPCGFANQHSQQFCDLFLQNCTSSMDDGD